MSIPTSPPLKYSHADESTQPLIDASDLERVQAILKGVFIYHRPYERIEQWLEYHLRMPRRQRSTSFIITAPSGFGKTAMLRAFERKYPEYIDPQGNGRRLPVLYAEFVEDPTPDRMNRELLAQAGIPAGRNPEKLPLHELLRRNLVLLDTRLVLLDEGSNAVDAPRPKAMCTWLKMLSNRIMRPVVVTGDDSIKSLFTDFAMSSRWPFTLDVPLWAAGPEFEDLLDGWEAALPLKLPSRLSSKTMVSALLKETQGITEALSQCLVAAAIVAIRHKRERITADLLPWWRDPPLFADRDLSFDEVAKAWLSDTREKPMPLHAFSLLGKMSSRRGGG